MGDKKSALRFWLYPTAVLAVPLLVWGIDRAQTLRWVGSTDLELVVQVTDAETGDPIAGATLHVIDEKEWDGLPLTYSTDENGVYRRVFEDQTTVGRQSVLGFTDTRAVYPVPWLVRVTADGYQDSDYVELWDQKYRMRIVRKEPTGDRLVVEIRLREEHD